MDWLTTTTLLGRLRDGEDAASWELLVGRFRPVIMGMAVRASLSPEAAEDVAQETLETFLIRYRHGDYVRDKGRLRSWLFGIAHNKVLEHLRRRSAQNRPLDAGVDDLDQLAAPEVLQPAFDVEWERTMLETAERRARAEFSPRTWQAYEGAARRGERPEDVGEALGMTPNAVYIAKHKVLKRLRELLADCEDLEDG